ncbi:TetR/AcrR family transcriptional regulator [Solicola sp. PLA-1-18]|uniref:TetR/AcrR family transcriptional regulator n=1 Tax=Solicola sp. PLA-1-18 TaxID=3380532 RepID=UPI003B7B7308
MTTTTDRILDSAESLFFTDGIAVTGIDRVAESAGVAIATLYKHVGSKDGLLEAVLARRLRSWTEHWDAAIEAAGSSTDRLLAVFDAVAAFRASAGATQWCCFLATASERPRPAGDASDPVHDLVDQDSQLVGERLHRLAAEADLDDPAAVASRLLLVYNGVLGSLLRGTPDDPVGLARDLASAVVESARRGRDDTGADRPGLRP